MKSFFSGFLLLFTMLLTSCSPSIQKKFEVTTDVGLDNEWYLNEDAKFIFDACLKSSLTQNQFDELLSKGAKVVTIENFKYITEYLDAKGDPYQGYCIGKSYILEGSKLLLDQY